MKKKKCKKHKKLFTEAMEKFLEIVEKNWFSGFYLYKGDMSDNVDKECDEENIGKKKYRQYDTNCSRVMKIEKRIQWLEKRASKYKRDFTISYFLGLLCFLLVLGSIPTCIFGIASWSLQGVLACSCCIIALLLVIGLKLTVDSSVDDFELLFIDEDSIFDYKRANNGVIYDATDKKSTKIRFFVFGLYYGSVYFTATGKVFSVFSPDPCSHESQLVFSFAPIPGYENVDVKDVRLIETENTDAYVLFVRFDKAAVLGTKPDRIMLSITMSDDGYKYAVNPLPGYKNENIEFVAAKSPTQWLVKLGETKFAIVSACFWNFDKISFELSQEMDFQTAREWYEKNIVVPEENYEKFFGFRLN